MNSFYTEFDITRTNGKPAEEMDRTFFQVERDRMIYSSEFRRLQGKTQVFLPGEYDFYRTRLTHSIEVSQIGRAIRNYLMKTAVGFDREYYIDSDLVEAACLAHDLGHPPFGHAGERTLNELMQTYGGFEGNAQTLRLITEIFWKEDDHRRGLKPSRAFLDSVLKYKKLYSDYYTHPDKHFLYDNQKEFRDFIFDGTPINEIEDLNKFRSIECRIMDWADDTAYANNDLVDSIAGGFITEAKLRKWKESAGLTIEESEITDELTGWIKNDKYKNNLNHQIGNFITACTLTEWENPLSAKSNRYKYRLEVAPEIKIKNKVYKKISNALVFQSAQLHQMEFKGDFMIRKVFNVLIDNYVENGKRTSVKLMDEFSDSIIRREPDSNKKARLVCDYIAGMTDNFAVRTYRRLFDPTFGSISDLV